MANASQAHQPHHSVRGPITENPKQRVANRCAISISPVLQDDVAGAGELGQRAVVGVCRDAELQGEELPLRQGPGRGQARVDRMAGAFGEIGERHLAVLPGTLGANGRGLWTGGGTAVVQLVRPRCHRCETYALVAASCG